jgi:hypothetical protein
MRPHYLTVIPGGLRRGETVRSKLLTRPHDFPEEIFKRLYIEAGGDLDIATIVDIWDRRDAGLKARGIPADKPRSEKPSVSQDDEDIPAFLRDS